jgi:signal transduction histidine kinase
MRVAATPDLSRQAAGASWRAPSRALGLRHLPGRRVLWVALWPLGLAAGIGLLALTLSNESRAALNATTILGVLLGWSFVASGLVVWARRPENRLGPLMVGLGMLWLVGGLLNESSSSPVFTAGIWIGDIWVIFFVVFLLAFPSGRLASRVDALLVMPFVVGMVPLELLWLLFYESEEPGNALLVWPNADAAHAIDLTGRAIAVAGALILTAVLARRWQVASPPLRRTLTPILVGGAAILVASSRVVTDGVAGRLETMELVALSAIVTVPLAVMAGLLRARLARSAVGDIFVELGQAHAHADVRDALARALGDPSLTLAFWVPDYESYVGVDGRPISLPGEDSGRIATIVERGGKEVAALVHDESLRDEPELVAAVCAAAGIALENERLQADLRARLEELRGSRARIVEVGDAERRRLERNLHDGAQQRLVSLSVELQLVASRLEQDSEAAELLAAAREGLAAALVELRELARGIHPGVLSDHGLGVALEALAARTPLPVRLSVDVAERLPEAVEVAAYFLVSEGLTNVAKYANASAATVDVVRENGLLVVEVIDDGVGGADPGAGSGLRGLADRIEALNGRVRIWSPPGGGTKLRAAIPCA